MIAKLKGIVDTILSDGIILDVNGVGYEVFMPSNALSRVEVGDVLSVDIITVVREDAFTLYGFLRYADKQWFETLISIQGVGAKVALAIQSILSADDLYTASMAGDNTAFARANGVGPKLANRIVLELKGKVEKMVAKMPVGQNPIGAFSGMISVVDNGTDDTNNTALHEAVSALTNLGFGRSQSYSVLQDYIKDTDNDDADTASLISVALKRLQG